MKIKKLKLFPILFFLVCGKAYADPVTYDELVSGDLARLPTDSQNFQFDVGVNTISGIWSGLFPRSDADGFSFTIPDGSKLTGITYEYDDSAVSLSEGYLLTSTFSLVNSSGLLSRQSIFLPTEDSPFPTPASPAQLFNDVLPLQADTYNVFHNIAYLSLGTTGLIANRDGGIVPYAWSFTLESLAQEPPPTPSAVPVPAAVWLFGTALIGLAGFSRRPGL